MSKLLNNEESEKESAEILKSLSDKEKLEYMKKIRAQTQAKWKALGFLDGLTESKKQNIAELFECEASQLLRNQKAVHVSKKMNEDFEKKKK